MQLGTTAAKSVFHHITFQVKTDKDSTQPATWMTPTWMNSAGIYKDLVYVEGLLRPCLMLFLSCGILEQVIVFP